MSSRVLADLLMSYLSYWIPDYLITVLGRNLDLADADGTDGPGRSNSHDMQGQQRSGVAMIVTKDHSQYQIHYLQSFPCSAYMSASRLPPVLRQGKARRR